MSTKIYNGFRVRGAKSLDDAFELLNTADNRKHVYHLVSDLTRKYLAARVSRIIDRAYLEPDNAEATRLADSPVMNAITEMWRDQREAKAEQRNHLTDFDIEISLVPVGTGKSRQILGLLFTGQRELTEWFMALPEIDDFAYWNNTDQPDEISDRQWEARGKLWDRALGSDAPAARGVTLQLHPPQPLMPTDRDPLRKFMRSVPERARDLASDHISSMQLKKLLAPITDEKERKDAFGKHFWASQTFTKTDEGRALVDKLAADYEKILPDLMTLEF